MLFYTVFVLNKSHCNHVLLFLYKLQTHTVIYLASHMAATQRM